MALDIIVAGVILVIVIAAGISARVRTGNTSERFAAGRQMSWFRLGASMAATSTSADTPILIAGAVYFDGLSGNWFWWASVPGALATIFFFARLWRRSGALTEIEIIHLRYGADPAARTFRMIRAVVDGMIVNCLVLATNVFAFSLLIETWLRHIGFQNSPLIAGLATGGLFIATGIYALIVGFRGLVRADSVEFFVAILASAALAWFAVTNLPHGLESLKGLSAARSGEPVLDIWPASDFLTPILLLTLGWWHNAPGNGMLIQRIVASRNEREATLTVATFAGLHYLLRPWGWYLAGAAALMYLPGAHRAEDALPSVAATVLPSGFSGLLVIAMALAFMGSVNSRLNFGASYIVNDVAGVIASSFSLQSQRFIEAGTIVVLSTIVLTVASSGALPTIRAIYQFLIIMMAGSGFVAIARWYWWRTTLASEIAALASATLIAALSLFVADVAHPREFALVLAVNFLVGAVVTIVTALLWPPHSQETARAFYERVCPEGPGWGPFGKRGKLLKPLGLWLLANIALFTAIFASASLIAGNLGRFAALAMCSAISALLAFRAKDQRQINSR